LNTVRPIVLASKSPRRSQLLGDCGFTFRVQTQDTDESFDAAMPVMDVAPYLARKKAMACREFILGNEILMTADTVVIFENEIFNKPADAAEAFAMLKRLQGQQHTVVTGVCLISIENGDYQETVFADATKVWFAAMTDAEIHFYIKNYNPFDKAGSYGAQDWIGLTQIVRLEGTYTNVMGLPTTKVYEFLNMK
jgi:septum formation protein